ncbi:MAG: hypothetical protein ACOX80_06030 [Methanomassiliicoccaceae archaeon]|jgi:hypothetical protein
MTTSPFDGYLVMQSSVPFSSAIHHHVIITGPVDNEKLYGDLPDGSIIPHTDMAKPIYADRNSTMEAKMSNGVLVRDHQASTATAAGFDSRALRHSIMTCVSEGGVWL